MPSEGPRRGGLVRGLVALSVAVGGLLVLLSAERRRGASPEGSRAAPDWKADPTRLIGYGRPQEPPSPQALQDGYEPQDASARSLGLVMVVGVITIAACIAGLFVLLGILHARDADHPPLTARQRTPLIPPGPPLQSDPQHDLAAFESVEAAKLQGYAWRDPRHSRARIPIERAMTIVVGTPLDPPQ